MGKSKFALVIKVEHKRKANMLYHVYPISELGKYRVWLHTGSDPECNTLTGFYIDEVILFKNRSSSDL